MCVSQTRSHMYFSVNQGHLMADKWHSPVYRNSPPRCLTLTNKPTHWHWHTHKQTKTDVDRKKWCLDWEKSEQWRQWDTQSLTNHLSLFCVNWNTNHLEIMDICVQCAWIILFFYLTLLAMWASFHISRKTLFDYVIELPNDFVYDTFC